jgi:hypothetical protein
MAVMAVACASWSGCAGRARPVSAADDARSREPRLEDALDAPPDLLVVVRPARLVHDPLYGPLLRRASRLASERAAVASAVGTTTLAALERADEVLVAVYDPEARDAIVAVRGVPADVDPLRLVDTDGTPLWTLARDLAGGATELRTSTRTDERDAALFVLPRRAWVIAAGPAVARARVALTAAGPTPGAPAHGGAAALSAVDPSALAAARFDGEAFRRVRPQLAEGALAPIVTRLDHATATLAPAPVPSARPSEASGPQGEVGEITLRFVYADESSARASEACLGEVVGAFTRRWGESQPWLHAIRVGREERAVLVRGRIPRAWADGFIHLEL